MTYEGGKMNIWNTWTADYTNIVDWRAEYLCERKKREAAERKCDKLYKELRALEKKKDYRTPKRILKNGDYMTVLWEDGTNTVVKRGQDEPESDYAAFTAALGIKIFGSNSALKKVVGRVETQKPKKKKQTEQKAPETAEQTETVIDAHDEPVTVEEAKQKELSAVDREALERVAKRFDLTADEAIQKIIEAQKSNED